MSDTVRRTQDIDFLCPKCGTKFTRSWDEVTITPTRGVRHECLLRWTTCSSCQQFIVFMQTRIAVAGDWQTGNGWTWRTTQESLLWPKVDREVDPRTGLLVAGVYSQDIMRYIDESRTSGTPLSLLLVDIDHFKQVNDSSSYEEGNSVLRATAAIVLAVAEGKKLRAYRYGGEEFVVLLPDYEAEEAVALAERIRKVIAAKPLGKNPRPITVSIGVSTSPQHGGTPEALFSSANVALKAAKQGGRNRVVLAGDPSAGERGDAVQQSGSSS
jgi:diguanylate cyclase (GGDEF)-like protein